MWLLMWNVSHGKLTDALPLSIEALPDFSAEQTDASQVQECLVSLDYYFGNQNNGLVSL